MNVNQNIISGGIPQNRWACLIFSFMNAAEPSSSSSKRRMRCRRAFPIAIPPRRGAYRRSMRILLTRRAGKYPNDARVLRSAHDVLPLNAAHRRNAEPRASERAEAASGRARPKETTRMLTWKPLFTWQQERSV